MAYFSSDGDYLSDYSRFITNFLERFNPDDQLPVRMPTYDVTEDEVDGEIIDMAIQHLNPKLCPPSLLSYIIHLILEEMKILRKQLPESCGFKPFENTYAPLKLMQAVSRKVNEICKRYMENSRLALLPPPSSMPFPLAVSSAIKNTRRKMEDRHIVLQDLNTIFNIKDNSQASYYAVFDGHAGPDAAIYCAAHLHQYLAESNYYPADPEFALRDAFDTTDAHFIKKSKTNGLNSGTTAVCALIIHKKLYVAWAGDSQVALAKRGKVNQLVNPHRPERNDERERIEAMGGIVMHVGTWRVSGHLAVSRAIGDLQYKPYVTGDPEIRCVILDGTEDFLIIACDGLWDNVDEDSAAKIVYRQICREPGNPDLTSARLVDFAKNQGSVDNITVIVVFLTPPSEIAARPVYSHAFVTDVKLDKMDSDLFLSNTNQCDNNSGFVKQPSQANGSDHHVEDGPTYVFEKSPNGALGSELLEYPDMDFGPETDVDALDDSKDVFHLQNVSRELFPDDVSEDETSNKVANSQPDLSFPTEIKPPPQNALSVDTENVGDSEDSDDEWNYYKVDPNKDKNPEVSAEAEVSLELSKKELPEVKTDDFEDLHREISKETSSPELINTKESEKVKEKSEPSAEEEDIMDFQLNPNAAEFVPLSPVSVIPSRLIDIPIAGSPLKQTPTMDDIRLPSPKEFQEEASHRPHEVENADDTISSVNGNFIDNGNSESTPEESVDHKKDLTADFLTSCSTHAELGDESDFSPTDLHKMDNLDGSFVESAHEFGNKDSMTMSFGPGTFNPLAPTVDLNAVHDLSDTDLCEDAESQKSKDIDEPHCDINSPEEHPELLDLISPESEFPAHSAAFPDRPATEELETVAECPTESCPDVEDLMEKIVAMNLKNDQLSEQSNVKTEEEFEPLKESAEANSDCLSSALPAESSSPLEFLSHTPDHCKFTDEKVSSNVEKPADLDDVNLMDQDMEKPDVLPSPDVGVFHNPLSPDFMSNFESKTEVVIPETDEMDPIQFEIDEEPVSAELDPPTGDPCSRSLSPSPDNQFETEQDIEPEVQEKENISVKLSESLQEFTGLETQLDPLINGDTIQQTVEQTPEIEFTPVTNVKLENCAVEAAEEHKPLVTDPVIQPAETKEELIEFETEKTVATPTLEAVPTALASTKPKTTTKIVSKAPGSKSTVKSTPVSPTKTSTSRPTSITGAKKPSATVAPNSKPSEVLNKASATSTKPPATKTTAKSSTLTAVRSNATTTTKPKPALTKTSKPISEKKPSVATNGDTKTAPIKSSVKPKPSTITSCATTTTKPLVKSTISARSTAPLAKPKVGLNSAAAKAPVKASTTAATAAPRPKTAPSTLGVTKSRVVTSAKSPVIDKQIKETANKQISSSRTTTTTKTSRTGLSTGASTTTTTNASSTVAKRNVSTGGAPTKKSTVTSTTRMSAKSATAASKIIVKPNGIKAKVQNGTHDVKEHTITTNTISNIDTTESTKISATSNGAGIQKDFSPVAEISANNQLIINSD